MYTYSTYSTYSIVTFYNIIQHQSLSTVCLTLIRSLSPFSRSPTRQRVESPPPPPASSCWPLNLAIQIYPWRSKQVRDVGWQGYDGICVFTYGVYMWATSWSHVWATSQRLTSQVPKGLEGPKIWLKKTEVFDWVRPGPMTSAEYARTHPRVLHKNRSSNTRPVSSVRRAPCVRHAYAMLSNTATFQTE